MRHARKLRAIPLWANIEKIKEIYRNRKKGYHVDHIVPLKGVNVCGLHVENNLQYLTAQENISKGNKLIC
jgi:5-methylcytosine-specific restriction endonuclease McrA